jgi:hypothetical protein
MTDVFDPVAGEIDRDDSIARAWRAANPDWRAWMYERIVEVARKKPYFITDDMERLRTLRQGPSTHENRAIGPLMLQAQRDKICLPTDDWVQSAQRVNHRRWMRVWYSLVYEGPRFRRPRRRKIIDPRQFDIDWPGP